MLIKKIPDTSGLVTATVSNTKLSEVENKLPGISSLVNTAVLCELVKVRTKFLIMLNILLLKNLIS